jgi:hypothetical protein
MMILQNIVKSLYFCSINCGFAFNALVALINCNLKLATLLSELFNLVVLALQLDSQSLYFCCQKRNLSFEVLVP